jgi:DNA-binding LytR/AlgR family response regulator
MMLTCVIVEDLLVAAEYTRNCCQKSQQLEVLGHFSNVADALQFLLTTRADLLFLDVEMPGATGFELIDQLPYSPKVILTTSKAEYAYPAFEYKVVDFLKKPYTYQRFQEALQKITVPELSMPLAAKVGAEDSMFIKCDGKLIRLNADEILYIESMGDYVKFVTKDRKLISLNTLKSLEERINKEVFLKVHRCYIVNLSKIDDIRENDLFIRGVEIPISKTHKTEILRRLHII